MRPEPDGARAGYADRARRCCVLGFHQPLGVNHNNRDLSVVVAKKDVLGSLYNVTRVQPVRSVYEVDLPRSSVAVHEQH